MDSPITRAEIDKLKKAVRAAEPYTSDDDIPFDGIIDMEREKSTMALRILKNHGINPYDDSDYGDITD